LAAELLGVTLKPHPLGHLQVEATFTLEEVEVERNTVRL
jgi:hypothetical protein